MQGTAKQSGFLGRSQVYVGVLLLELHLPGATLEQLHRAAHGSLAQFLRGLHDDLSTAAHVEPGQITILGIHGKYRRVDPEYTATGSPGPQHVDEEVLVKFSILPPRNGAQTDLQVGLDEAAFITSLQRGLASQKSTIMPGTIGALMKHAIITRAFSGVGQLLPSGVRNQEKVQLSAVFLPIGVSAAFTGILIWLAAW